MIWRVKYSKKGLRLVVLSIAAMIVMFIAMNYPARFYRKIAVKHLHNEELFHSLE